MDTKAKNASADVSTGHQPVASGNGRAAIEAQRYFDVQYEATTFTDDPDLVGTELSDEFIARFNERANAEGRFPTGIVQLVSGRISGDDEQEESDIHCFVSVVLRVAANSASRAERIEPPEELLDEAFQELAGDLDIDAPWEVLLVDEVDTNSTNKG